MASIAELIIDGILDINDYDKESKTERLENALINLEQKLSDDEDYQILIESLDKYFNKVNDVLINTKLELLSLIDHECEVFDPIYDGPIEHAEGMAMTEELIEKYFTRKNI